MHNTILTNVKNAIANGSHLYVECTAYSVAHGCYLPTDLVCCDLDMDERISRYFRKRGMKDVRFVVTVGTKGNKVIAYTNEGAI